MNHIPLGIAIQFCTGNSSSQLRATVNGESGIRTHAPFRTNGFQDRLVMTTSISLQAFSQTYFCILFHIPTFVKRFFQSFFFFCYILENTRSDTVSNMWFFLVFTAFSTFFYNTQRAVFSRFITLKTALFLQIVRIVSKTIAFFFSGNFLPRSYPPAL